MLFLLFPWPPVGFIYGEQTPLVHSPPGRFRLPNQRRSITPGAGEKALPRSVSAFAAAETPPAAPRVQAAGPDPSKLPANSSGQVPAAFSRATATSLTLVPVGPVITRPSTAFRA